MALCSAQIAWANCTTTGTTVFCDATSPNPYTNAIGGTDITLGAGAGLNVDPYGGAPVSSQAIALYGTNGVLNARFGSTIVSATGITGVVAGANTTVNMDGAIMVYNGGTGISLGQGATLNLTSLGLVNVSGAQVNGGQAAIQITGTGATVNIDGTAYSSTSSANSITSNAAISLISRDLFANTVRGTATINVNATGRVVSIGTATPAVILTSGSSLNIAGLVSASASNAIDYRGTAGGTASVNVLAGGTVQSSGSTAIIGSTGAMDLTVAGTVDAGGAATAIQLGSANDTVTLLTGSSVKGAIDGGGGTNTLTLTGNGTGQLGATANFSTVAINSGIWTLSAPLSPVNGIAIASGATGIGSAGQWGNAISNSGTLTFNQSANETYSGTLTGSGQLVKTGLGSLTLGNQSGFTGATLISAGRLVMAGAMPSAVTVASGGTLAGNGSVAGLIVQSGGTVSPSAASGSGVGTLNVAGNFTQASGSTYAALVNGGNASKITVSGAASLASGSKLVITTQNAVYGQSYTLLSAAGGVSGQYTVVQSDIAYRLTYDANNVAVTFGRSNAAMLALAQGANQQGMANGLIGLSSSNALYAALALTPDDATLRAAYPQLTGDLHGAVRAAILHAADMLTETALARTGTHQSGWRLWGQLQGSTGNSTGLGGATPVSRQSIGGVMGLENGLGAVTLGLAAGYRHTRLNAATGTASVNTPEVLAYARAALRGLSLQGGLGYVWASNHVSRQVSFTGFSDSDQASYKGNVLHGFGEIGVPVALGGGVVTPFVAGRVYRLSTDGFAEQGGAAALQGEARTRWSEMTELGARLATPVAGGISAQGRVAWQHRYGASQGRTTLGFVAGGQSFAVSGADLSRNAAAFDLGLNWAGAKGVVLDVGYHGVLGEQGVDHAGRVTLSLKL
ncbi:autotransporter-associated beta strand protein [Novosphingobium sp. SG751A]|uniref:autotransporter outer membrane beta-barrel domain-containing protein n=1 Tax=Novosphingobium sp. SG751A TaxID=2587000 RepID=UPI0015519B11|nr:autotransporter domain-containing protein [Novosphingobium sp. SG751A]NOW48330.1 autotransporter-associated beta strand protein [Novosphingobium sp. SG751A]